MSPVPDFRSWPKKVYEWVDERLEISPILEHFYEKVVPQHRHTFWYYWGGIALFLFCVQVVTGILLLIYYKPGPDAYDSVRQITYEIEFGWLIRSIHAWSATLMVGVVCVHMFSVFLMRAFRKPREFGWWSGMALLGLTLVFGFSGYLLPMDDLAYFATKVGLSIPEPIPFMERIITNVVRGGPDVTDSTIQRFFALHVVVLPLIFIPVLCFHLWLVQKHGNAVPPGELARPEPERRSIPFFPNFMMKDLAVWLITLNVLAVLAAIFPWKLGPKADPLASAPIGIHPEWYFMSPFELLKLLGRILPGAKGEILGLVLFTAGIVLWALIPLYDTDVQWGRRARRTTYFGLGFLFILIATTIIGYFDI